MANTDATQPATSEAAPIESLLRRERKKFSSYWTLLNEMRLRGELPDWVRKSFPEAGQHEDWEANHADQSATNVAVRGAPDPARFGLGLTNDNEAFLHSQDGHLLFQGKPSELVEKHPDALFEFTRSQLSMYVNALHREVARDVDGSKSEQGVRT